MTQRHFQLNDFSDFCFVIFMYLHKHNKKFVLFILLANSEKKSGK